VLLRDHGAAQPEAAAAGTVDQLPGLVAGRVGERGAAGARADRLRGLARRTDLVHAGGDRGGIARFAREPGGDEDPVLGRGRVAIGEPKLRRAHHVPPAGAIERHRLDQHILELAAIGAGIHPQRAADGTGDAAEEFEAGDAGLLAGEGDVEVERAGAGLDRGAVDADVDEAAAQPHHHTGDAAVAHQQVRGDADHRHRHVGRLGGEKRGEILGVSRTEQYFGGAADAEPGDGRERRVLAEPAAHRGQALDEAAGGPARGHHAAPPAA